MDTPQQLLPWAIKLQASYHQIISQLVFVGNGKWQVVVTIMRRRYKDVTSGAIPYLKTRIVELDRKCKHFKN